MKHVAWIAICSASLAVAACKNNEPPVGGQPVGGGAAAAPVDVKALAAQGAVVIDVRNQEEWDGDGHLDKSTLIPLPQLQARLAEVATLVGGDKSKPIITVCLSGGRAEQAKQMLTAAGYTNVHNAGRWQRLK